MAAAPVKSQSIVMEVKPFGNRFEQVGNGSEGVCMREFDVRTRLGVCGVAMMRWREAGRMWPETVRNCASRQLANSVWSDVPPTRNVRRNKPSV